MINLVLNVHQKSDYGAIEPTTELGRHLQVAFSQSIDRGMLAEKIQGRPRCLESLSFHQNDPSKVIPYPLSGASRTIPTIVCERCALKFGPVKVWPYKKHQIGGGLGFWITKADPRTRNDIMATYIQDFLMKVKFDNGHPKACCSFKPTSKSR